MINQQKIFPIQVLIVSITMTMQRSVEGRESYEVISIVCAELYTCAPLSVLVRLKSLDPAGTNVWLQSLFGVSNVGSGPAGPLPTPMPYAKLEDASITTSEVRLHP